MPQIRTLQILVAALIAGVALFAAVVIWMRTSGSTPPAAPAVSGDMLLLMLAGVAFATMGALLVVPPMIARQAGVRYKAAATEEERQAVALQSLSVFTIVRCALVEGVGLFAIVIYMLSGEWGVLVAPALTLLALIAFMPSEWKFRAWRERLGR